MKNKLNFKANGTEGMLDVILACTLIFMLMSALASAEGKGQSLEKELPPMELSSSKDMDGEGESDTQRLTISLKLEQGKVLAFIENEQIPLASLEEKLRQMPGLGYVALRREPGLTCAVEDQVILACRRAGIDQVTFVIREKK